MKASPINITIIQIYAPTYTYNDEAIDQFYENIDDNIQESHQKDILIMQGDFNAKVEVMQMRKWLNALGDLE